MRRETRNWSAAVRRGAVPKLVVRGEVRTHPYAQVFLKEGRSQRDKAHILCLTLTVLADTPRAELQQWTPVRFERSLLSGDYAGVRINGAGSPVLIDVTQPAGVH